MGDPELRGDESVILRTPGVFVKSFQFEGILTNKRIILVDKAKNLLPQKEIPLVTIKDIEVGENSIRDQIITLRVVAKSGEMREMILTFSRQMGGNRIRERDAWANALKENISSSFEQVVRKVTPVHGPVPKKPDRTVLPRIEVISPESKGIPPVSKTLAKKEIEVHHPGKISVFSQRPGLSQADEKGSDKPVTVLGTYCSRCGNRVPEGSGFCNRCGSPIVVPGQKEATTRTEKVPQSPKQDASAKSPPVNPDEPPIEPSIDFSAGERLSVPLQEITQHPESPEEPESPAPFQETIVPESDSLLPVINERPELNIPDITSSQVSESISLAGEFPPPKKPRFSFRINPNRPTAYAIGILLLLTVAIVGGFFIYPLLFKGGSIMPNTSTSPTAIATITVSSGTFTPIVTPVVTIPGDGVFVHIKYLGGWKGSYGVAADLQNITNSGDRYYSVENASGSVEASFEKLDGSTKQTLLVEILKNGKILTSGNTTAGFGKVILSVDTATGIARSPQISEGAGAKTSATTTTPTTQKTGNLTVPSTTVANTTSPG